METFLRPIDNNISPLDHCVVLTVEEDEQIEVQSGDVVGYYVDSNKVDNGIQWIEGYKDDDDDDVRVYYKDDLPRESIKSHYGIGVNPTECAFVLPANDDTNSYSISLSNRAAPIISVSIGKTRVISLNYKLLLSLQLLLFQHQHHLPPHHLPHHLPCHHLISQHQPL